MNIKFGGMSNLAWGNGLKSTAEKLQRQQECQSQVDFFEKQKDNLKNMKCESLEDIARKLDMFHSYNDQIAAAKQAYNSEQMWHVMDEARELAEKIAEKREEMEAKTAEERREEMAEEALGIEENSGLLSEVIEELEEVTEELAEEVEEVTEELTEEIEEVMDAEEVRSGEIENVTEKLAEETEEAYRYRHIDLIV